MVSKTFHFSAYYFYRQDEARRKKISLPSPAILCVNNGSPIFIVRETLVDTTKQNDLSTCHKKTEVRSNEQDTSTQSFLCSWILVKSAVEMHMSYINELMVIKNAVKLFDESDISTRTAHCTRITASVEMLEAKGQGYGCLATCEACDYILKSVWSSAQTEQNHSVYCHSDCSFYIKFDITEQLN